MPQPKAMMVNQALRQARYERACWWLKLGVDLVPLKPTSKHLQPGYGASKAHIATTDFARKWFLNTDANLGVVLGNPAGLVVADWDNARDYETWRSGAGATVETLTEQSVRGYHVFFFDVHLPSAEKEGCEFKTSGVCMVAPSVHPSGKTYSIINDRPIMSLSERKVLLLFPFLSEKLFAHLPLDRVGVPSSRNEKASRAGLSLVQRIKEARPIVAELEAAGVTDWQRSGRNLVARCVFHQDDSPSLWVNPASGLWGCNAASCPVHDGRHAHDVINARAFRYGISNDEAIKQLADEYLSRTSNT
jgi:hypothetical protein